MRKSALIEEPPKTQVPQAPVWIEVDLKAIQHNFQQVRRHLPSKIQLLTVVKANAYGHGLLPVTRALLSAGADLLGAASVAEATATNSAFGYWVRTQPRHWAKTSG